MIRLHIGWVNDGCIEAVGAVRNDQVSFTRILSFNGGDYSNEVSPCICIFLENSLEERPFSLLILTIIALEQVVEKVCSCEELLIIIEKSLAISREFPQEMDKSVLSPKRVTSKLALSDSFANDLCDSINF